MALYDKFATIYQRGPYLRFSQVIVETILPEYLEELGIEPEKVLDIACGEGSFAVGMSKLGYAVTGVDQSPQMISLAKAKAQAEGEAVEFYVEDMRSLQFDNEFDLATCFFDSVNYMLTVKDLDDAFQNAYQALKPGGFYIFDMNTIFGLAVDWMRAKTYIQNEGDDFIEIHRQEYDYENQIATMHVIIFKQQGELWERIDEAHHERGYPIADIQYLLTQMGFTIMGMYGSLRKRTEVTTNSPRVWFVVRKPQ
jgi:SAM-dependent methyltransferase